MHLATRGNNKILRTPPPNINRIPQFSFYIADMPRSTDPVKRVCYAVDLTVWALEVNKPDIEVSPNSYLEEVTEGQLFADFRPKSSVTLLTSDTPSQGLS